VGGGGGGVAGSEVMVPRGSGISTVRGSPVQLRDEPLEALLVPREDGGVASGKGC